MENWKEFSQKIDWGIIRGLLIRLILVVPIIGLFSALQLNSSLIRETLKLLMIHTWNLEELEQGVAFAQGLSGIFLIFLWVSVFVSLFIVITMQSIWKFFRRLFRWAVFAIQLGMAGLCFLILAEFWTRFVDDPFLNFMGNLSAGMVTEIFGTILIFLLLDTLAKTWEENEEDAHNEAGILKHKLKIILSEWEEAKTKDLKALEQSEVKRAGLAIRTRETSLQKGRVEGLSQAISDLKKLID